MNIKLTNSQIRALLVAISVAVDWYRCDRDKTGPHTETIDWLIAAAKPLHAALGDEV